MNAITPPPMIDGRGPVVQSATQRESRLAWLADVANQITGETGLTRVDDIDDIVAISYVGLLSSPPPELLTRDGLLRESRQQLLIWVWEQGRDGRNLPLAKASG